MLFIIVLITIKFIKHLNADSHALAMGCLKHLWNTLDLFSCNLINLCSCAIKYSHATCMGDLERRNQK
jgi:hypothetical protein